MTNVPVPTPRDDALRYTAMIANGLLRGEAPTTAATIHAPFPPQFADDEQLWAVGLFKLYDLRSVGDGTYMEDSSMFFATGAVGLAFTAAFYGARKIGNGRRRREAEAALTPRWVEAGMGDLYVGTHGFYMHSAHGLWSWSWGDIQSADMMGPAWLRFTGESRDGQANWSIVSDWAELLSSYGRPRATRDILS